MTTFLAHFEFNGAPYRGWQSQPGQATVQGQIEAALKTLTRQDILIQACGRTDSGVHAIAMPASFQIDDPHMVANRVREGLNGILGREPITCLDVFTMPDAFNARFDCLGRAYEYRILARRAPPALLRGQVHSVRVPLDAEAMHTGAQHLIGNHDFTTFRSRDCQASSPQKTLDHLSVERRGGEIVIQAAARSFLHHQVRLMAGSLIMVGKGHWQPNQMAEILAARDSTAAGPMAASEGLYFLRGDYADLPEPGPYARNLR